MIISGFFLTIFEIIGFILKMLFVVFMIVGVTILCFLDSLPQPLREIVAVFFILLIVRFLSRLLMKIGEIFLRG